MRTWTLGILLAAGLAAAPAAQAYTGYVVRSANLRTGPDAGYPRIVTLPAGATVDIFGCIEDWSWCDVQWRGERGWISGGLIDYDYSGNRVGIYDYGPQLGLPILAFAFDTYWSSYYRDRNWYRERDRWRTYHPAPPPPRPAARPWPPSHGYARPQPRPPQHPTQQPRPPGHPTQQPRPPSHPTQAPRPPNHPTQQPRPPGHPTSQQRPSERPASQQRPPDHPTLQQRPPGHPTSQQRPPQQRPQGQQPAPRPGGTPPRQPPSKDSKGEKGPPPRQD